VKTLDDNVKAYVSESYITYNDSKYNSWFKNVLLTPEYYYTETVDDIYNGHESYEGEVEKIESLKLVKHFFSQPRILFSENIVVIGNDNTDDEYYIISLKKEDANNSIFYLRDNENKRFEITLLDDGTSITITHFFAENEITFPWLAGSALNKKCIKYDT